MAEAVVLGAFGNLAAGDVDYRNTGHGGGHNGTEHFVAVAERDYGVGLQTR